MDFESFDNFCIICDKFIAVPKAVEEDEAKAATKEVKPKKKPAGCIRVSKGSCRVVHPEQFRHLGR